MLATVASFVPPLPVVAHGSNGLGYPEPISDDSHSPAPPTNDGPGDPEDIGPALGEEETWGTDDVEDDDT